jgi:hypothetical protein
MHSRARPFAAASLLAALLCGACAIGHGKADAEKAVATFHAQYARQQFDSMYVAADAGLKESSSQPEFVRFMSAVHRKLGNVKQTKLAGWNVQANTGGSFAILTYETDFERGHGTETFHWRIGGAGPRLQGYNINSAALVVD